MKRMILALSVAAIAVVAIAGMDEKTAKAELSVLEAKALKAFKTKDAATLVGMLDEKFVWKHIGGRPNENKTQAAAGLKQWFGMCDSINIKWTHKSFSCKGNTVTAVTHEEMSCKMKAGADKKVHVMKSSSDNRETWVKGAKGWKATMFEDMPGGKYWMDGKPFDPNKMGS